MSRPSRSIVTAIVVVATAVAVVLVARGPTGSAPDASAVPSSTPDRVGQPTLDARRVWLRSFHRTGEILEVLRPISRVISAPAVALSFVEDNR